MSVAVQNQIAYDATKDASVERKPVLADRYKTRMCRNYEETGKCPYEVKCMFAHGERELRTSEMNVEDGLVTEDAIRKFQREMILKRRAELEAEEAKRVPQYQQPAPYYNHQYPYSGYNTYGGYSSYGATTHQPYSYNGSYSAPGAYHGYEQCNCPDCMGAYNVAPPVACATECTCEECLAAQQQAVGPASVSAPTKQVYEEAYDTTEAP